MTDFGVRMFRSNDLGILQNRLAEGEMGCLTSKRQAYLKFPGDELILLNEKMSEMGADEPANAGEGFAWRETDADGNFVLPYAWLKRGNKWVSDRLFEETLTGESEGDIIRKSPIQAAISGDSFANEILVEELFTYISADVDDGEQVSHSIQVGLTRAGLDLPDVLGDYANVDLVGPVNRRYELINQTFQLDRRDQFKLKAMADDTVAEALVSVQLGYRLVRGEAPAPAAPETPDAG